MKTTKTTLILIALFSITFSCKKKKTAPTLTLNGESSITICLGDVFTDPGAMSIDAYDEDISSLIEVVSNVNSDSLGSYTIEYTSTDENDNVSVLTRNVQVLMCVSSIIGDYAVSHDCTILGQNIIGENQSISLGATDNDFNIDNFNTFINQVPATIDGVNVTVPTNVFTIGSGLLSADVTIDGTGTINDLGTEITIEYNYDAGLLGSGTCTAVYTK